MDLGDPRGVGEVARIRVYRFGIGLLCARQLVSAEQQRRLGSGAFSPTPNPQPPNPSPHKGGYCDDYSLNMECMSNESDEQIVKLCRTLWTANPLRRQAELVLANRFAPIEDIGPVLRAIRNRTKSRETECAVAEWIVENAAWTDEQRDTITLALSARVEKAIRSRKPAMYTLRWFLRGMVLSLVFWTGCAACVRWDEGIPGPLELFFGSLLSSAVLTLVGSFITLPLSIFIDNLTSSRMTRDVYLLGKVGGPGCIRTLATAYTHLPMRDAAASALALVGAKVRPTDYGALPAQTVPSLCSALTKADNKTALVILHVLESVGDERAINTVAQKLIETPSTEILEVARRVLGILRQRADESRTSGA